MREQTLPEESGAKMRICYISDAGSIHTQRWISYFAERGHEIHLISPRMGEGYAKGVRLHLLIRLMPQIWPATRYMSGLLWLVQIRRLVSRIKPDILDAHGITVNGYLAVASGFHPLVLTAWGSDILIDPKRNAVYRFLTKQALKIADRVICFSSAIKKEAIELGAVPDKLEVIFLGIDTRKFSPTQKDTMILQRLNIPNSSPVVISTRSLRPVYDVETFIRAIPLVLEEVPEARFIIGGQGEQRNYLEKLAQNLSISDSIRFVGWIPHEELPGYLASSDVYVSTSLSDGTSINLLEAMACKLAPVVTDIVANRGWITEGKNGCLVPTRDHKILAEKVIFLLKDKDTRRKFGTTGRSLVVGHAEYVRKMEEVEKIYENLVNKVNNC